MSAGMQNSEIRKGDRDMYRFCMVRDSDMYEQIKGLKSEMTEHNIVHFSGFRYFSPEHIGRGLWKRPHLPEDQFAIAMYEESIVGVCLLQKSEYEENVWWISYVDVHSEHRRRGIAKALYRVVNEWVDPSIILYGSRLSADGEAANLYGLKQEAITRCTVFDNDTDYNEWLSTQHRNEEESGS